MMSSKHSFFKTWGILLATFLLGGVAGGALGRSFFSRPPFDPHAREFRVADLETALKLTPEQGPEVRAIIEDLRVDYSGICAEVRPRYDEARTRARTRMRALLTAEQQGKFDELIPEQECASCPRIASPDESEPAP